MFHCSASFDGQLVHEPGAHDELLEGGRPAVPVLALRLGRDRGDELLTERFAIALEARLDDGGRETEHARLPRRVEDELPVAAWGSRGAVDVQQIGFQRRATPIIESRVTSAASSSSDNDSVPAGRSGTTK